MKVGDLDRRLRILQREYQKLSYDSYTAITALEHEIRGLSVRVGALAASLASKEKRGQRHGNIR